MPVMLHKKSNQTPRRSDLNLHVPAELAIRNAMNEVERLPADPELMEAVNDLQCALNRVMNYIDNELTGTPPRPMPVPCGNSWKIGDRTYDCVRPHGHKGPHSDEIMT